MPRTLHILANKNRKSPKRLRSNHVTPRGLKLARVHIRTKLKAFLKEKRKGKSAVLYWLNQEDLLENLGLSFIKKRARKGVLAEAGSGSTEPKLFLETLKKTAVLTSCSSLFTEGQFESKQ